MMRISKIINPIMIVAITAVAFASCMKDEAQDGDKRIVVRDIQSDFTPQGDAIESISELNGKTFGMHAYRTSNSSTYFTNANAAVTGNTATITPTYYWPADRNGTLKLFSWYPNSGTYAPTTSFSGGVMTMNYTANSNAANHVDVLAAISQPTWGSGIDVGFHHTLTKVTFTFQTINPAPDNLTISKIELQNVGQKGTLTMSDLPTATTKNGKKKFVWSGITTGNFTSTPSANTVTTTATPMGDTFLMLPAGSFSDDAKIVFTTNFGIREFPLKDIAAKTPHSWESGEHINYSVTYTNSTFQISAKSVPWKENTTNVIFDKQYYLKVSKTTSQHNGNAATIYIDVETNYKNSADPDTGFPAGASLVSYEAGVPGSPWPNGVTMWLGDWANATMTLVSETDGLYKYKITLYMQPFVGAVGGNRWDAYYVRAGNMMQKMSVQQYESETWLSAAVEDDPIDNADRKRIKLTTSGTNWWGWEVTELSDPHDIFLNKETILGSSGGNGSYIYFYFKANATPGETATITFTNTNGDNPPFVATITAP